MDRLNLPEYEFSLQRNEDQLLIYDVIRKKYIKLTPEEWVRQNFITFLIREKAYPQTLIAIERQQTLNTLAKRTDAVLYNNQGDAVMILEFKAPNVKIDNSTFEQIARYNINLKANYLTVSNGMEHYCCAMDYGKHEFTFLKDIPEYPDL